MLLLQLGRHIHAMMVTGAASRVQVELACPPRLRTHVTSHVVQHVTTLSTELVVHGSALSGVACWRLERRCRRAHGALLELS